MMVKSSGEESMVAQKTTNEDNGGGRQ